MNQDSHSDEKIIDVLSLKTVAVIGMSKHPSKAAHYVPKYLIVMIPFLKLMILLILLMCLDPLIKLHLSFMIVLRKDLK